MALSLVAALPLVAAAQDKSQPADPANPAEAVSAPLYDSAFKTYQPLNESSESPAKTWRAANDEVARIGGHVGSIKEDAAAAESSVPSKSPSDKTPEAAPVGHGAHQKH